MKWMLKCRENTVLVTRSLDQPLSLGERVQMHMHLALCKVCKRYAQQLEWLDQALRQKHAQESLGPAAKERIIESLKQHP